MNPGTGIVFHDHRQDYLIATNRNSNFLRDIIRALGIVAPKQNEKITSTDRTDDFSV
jgi:hypothetical protein